MSANRLARSPEEGARLLALSFLDQARAARPRLADPEDTEALHDFRVALRRLRSCLRSYRSFLDESVPRKLAKKLKKVAQATGPGRDTEVQISWLRGRSPHLASSHRAGLSWMLAQLEKRMREGYEDAREEIERDFDKIEADLRRRLSVYHAEIHLGSGAPQATLADATAAILHTQVEELASHLARIEDADDEAEGHEARISAKRVRYLLEPFVEDLPAAGPIVKRFKALQDLLGDLHDAHVLETELTDAVETAAAERARRLMELSLAEVPDDDLLRAERRRSRESGLISLARLNRARRDRLFEALEAEWLHGEAEGFLREVEALGDALVAVAREAAAV